MFRWLRKFWPQYVAIRDLAELGGDQFGRVQIEGTADTTEPLLDPVQGRPGIGIVYKAWPPSTTLGMDGATSHNSRAYEVSAQQSCDFELSDGRSRVLVRVNRGEDLAALHQRLLDQHGVSLRVETEVVEVGERVRIWGRVEHRAGGPSGRHRELPYVAIVRADRFVVV